MSTWNHYHLARSIDDALSTLQNATGSSRLVAGGTDLLLDLQQGRHAPVELLVDITEVPEMTRLELRSEGLFIGAAVPLNRVIASPLVQEHAGALLEASGLIGGPQVRNTATLGGNVAHALPAGDGAIALHALDARAEIASPAGRRLARMGELYTGPGKSSLDHRCEILVGFHLNLKGSGEGSVFRRVMRPQGVAIAILNMAAWVKRDGDLLVDARLSAGPAGPVPFRALAAEALVRGRKFDAALVDEALAAFLSQARFRTSPHRSTAEYRRQMSGVLLSEVLTTAWQRAGSV